MTRRDIVIYTWIVGMSVWIIGFYGLLTV